MARLFHLLLPWTSPIANRIKGEFTLRERGSKSHPPTETILEGEGNETAGQQLPQLNSHYAVKSIGPLTPPIPPPSETFIPSSPSEQKDPPVKILRSTLKQAERERKGENLHPTEAINHNWTRRCFAYTGQRGGCENAFRGENKSKREIRK